MAGNQTTVTMYPVMCKRFSGKTRYEGCPNLLVVVYRVAHGISTTGWYATVHPCPFTHPPFHPPFFKTMSCLQSLCFASRNVNHNFVREVGVCMIILCTRALWQIVRPPDPTMDASVSLASFMRVPILVFAPTLQYARYVDLEWTTSTTRAHNRTFRSIFAIRKVIFRVTNSRKHDIYIKTQLYG